MEFPDTAAANAVLKQRNWELDGRRMTVELAAARGGGGGGGGGGGDAGGGHSKFSRTYSCFVDA